MKIYDTLQEKKELKFIKGFFKKYKIFNPNRDLTWRGSMKPYFDAVKKSKYVVCSEYKEHVGRGVFNEIKTALRNDIEVWCIKDEEMRKVIDLEVIDPNDLKIFYGILKKHPTLEIKNSEPF